MRFIDLTGQRFARLLVTARAERGGRRIYWYCRCECGTATIAEGSKLRAGHTRSCGCLVRDALHAKHRHASGGHRSREYRSWEAAKARCFNPANDQYHRYGGRGIMMCARWQADSAAFLADMGPCPDGFTLDRIDTNGHYEPANCRWADKRQQANNRRSNHRIRVRGREYTIAEAAREFGVSGTMLLRRVQSGWDTERALMQPSRMKRKPSRAEHRASPPLPTP